MPSRELCQESYKGCAFLENYAKEPENNRFRHMINYVPNLPGKKPGLKSGAPEG
jgi:hypothetical protein